MLSLPEPSITSFSALIFYDDESSHTDWNVSLKQFDAVLSEMTVD